MGLTNGFEDTEVLAALQPRKGWVQPTQTEFTPTLSVDVLKCLCPTPFNDDHAVCSPYILWKMQEDAGITTDNLNAYLMRLKTAVIMNSLNLIFKNRQVIEEPKLVWSKSFRTKYTPIPNSGKTCGWQIQVAEGSYAAKVDAISLLFNFIDGHAGAINVTLSLYNDMRKPAIWTKACVAQSDDQTIVNIDDLIMRYQSKDNKGGIFYLTYDQSEIAAQGAQALNCYLNDWNSFAIVDYQPFESTTGGVLHFKRDQYYSNFTTYGMNLEISTYKDYTNTICRNASQFDRILGLQMVRKCIEEVMFSGRSNKDERVSQENLDMLYMQLEGGVPAMQNRIPMAVNVPYKTGLKNDIEREAWRMTNTFFPKEQIQSTVPPVVGHQSNWNGEVSVGKIY